MRIITDYSSFVHEALASVRADLGDDNLSLNRHDTKMRRDGRIESQVTLRVEDSGGILARRSHSGRRMVSACWHGHYLFMAALFARDPNARITSMFADYRGLGEFWAVAPDTGRRNIGSQVEPLEAREACDCGLAIGAALTRVNQRLMAAMAAPTDAEAAALALMATVEDGAGNRIAPFHAAHRQPARCDDPGAHAPTCQCDGGEFVPDGGPHMDTCSCGCGASLPRGRCECGQPVGHP